MVYVPQCYPNIIPSLVKILKLDIFCAYVSVLAVKYRSWLKGNYERIIISINIDYGY